MPRWGRGGAEWRRVREQVLRGATHCQMPDCKYPGVPMDFFSPRTHPLHPTVDHIVQVKSVEGWADADRRRILHNPANLRPAHNACNASRNGKSRRATRTPLPSRSWGV